MKKISRFILNRYFITLVVFLLLILFFDRNDLFTQWQRKKQLNNLNETKDWYNNEINKNKKFVQDIKTNPNALEKVAREKYKMHKKNEDVFLIKEYSDKK